MLKAKKDYMPRQQLNDYIINEYRRGRTVKSIAGDVRSQTIDESGAPLPAGYIEQVVYEYNIQGGYGDENLQHM